MSRILIDAYWLVNGPPSGKNVVRSLIDTWLDEFPMDQISLAMAIGDIAPARAIIGHRAANVEFVGLRAKPHGLSVFLEFNTRGYDAVLTQNFAPFRGGSARIGVFVHDVIYRRHPEWFSRVERMYLRFSLRTTRTADVVFTSSRAEGDQISQLLSRRAMQVVKPVGLGLSKEFDLAEPVQPKGLPDVSRYYLTVGRLNARKNVGFCAGALLSEGLISPKVPLIVVGAPDGRGDSFADLQQAVADGSVIFMGHVTDSELKWLYERTNLFIFPSLDEGFGLPILEARTCGARMLVSDIPAFREVGPDAHFFDPRSARSIVRAVRQEEGVVKTEVQPVAKVETWPAVVTRIRGALLLKSEENT